MTMSRLLDLLLYIRNSFRLANTILQEYTSAMALKIESEFRFPFPMTGCAVLL
ncbi:hypothetical protein BGZ52_008574, partial [Haplosporangium bisporale]